MPIQLDKILADIAEEKVLHPNYSNANKKDMEDAWARVGRNNRLSVHEARSIFKVLQKKYDQERSKDSSSWKLFGIMEEIHRKVDIKEDVKTEEESEVPIEEDEEYEMLEVQEDDDPIGQPLVSTGSNGSHGSSDGESPSKSSSSNSSGSPDRKDEKTVIKILPRGTTATSNSSNYTASPSEEKKILNTLTSSSPRPPLNSSSLHTTSSTAAALHKKGITLKKTTGTANAIINSSTLLSKSQDAGTNTTQLKNPMRGGTHLLEVGKTIQLPESLKRKLVEEISPETLHLSQTGKRKLSEQRVDQILQGKKINVNQGGSTSVTITTPTTSSVKIAPSIHTHSTNSQVVQIKHEREDNMNDTHSAHAEATGAVSFGINLITIPGNPTHSDLVNGLTTGSGGPSSSTAATVASTSTNGFSPRIEDIDFKNDIIFDAGSNNLNNLSTNKLNTNGSEIINFGNFDNSLPPTFFKNLCNSARHEALGLYVANVMNRLRARSAAKLELGILRAIIDVQSDELEQFMQ